MLLLSSSLTASSINSVRFGPLCSISISTATGQTRLWQLWFKMSLAGLVTDTLIPHTTLTFITKEKVALRCNQCHRPFAYTDNDFVEDLGLYYPIKDVVLNEHHLYLDAPNHNDPRWDEARQMVWEHNRSAGITVNGVQCLYCKECETMIGAWITRNHGPNGRCVMFSWICVCVQDCSC